MHFRMRFLFDNNSVNVEMNIAIWSFLPGVTRIGSFFRSGDIWFETDRDWSVDEMSGALHRAIHRVFEHYREQDCFGYVESGYERFSEGDELFSLSVFNPPEASVERVKELLQNIKVVEESLCDMRRECGELFRTIE